VRTALREWGWLLPAFVVSAAIGGFVLPSVLPRAPWLSLVGVLVVLAVSFPTSARHDPIAFASIAIPPLTLTVIGLLLSPGIGTWLNIAALLFLLPFVFSGRWWRAWSRVVLRRRPSPVQLFYRQLYDHLAGIDRVYEEATEDGRTPEDALASVRTRIGQLRKLEAPDADWARVRDDCAANAHAWLEVASSGASSEVLARFEEDRDALAARIQALVASGESSAPSPGLDGSSAASPNLDGSSGTPPHLEGTGASRPQAPGSATDS
jgi:hypothetical protein